MNKLAGGGIGKRKGTLNLATVERLLYYKGETVVSGVQISSQQALPAIEKSSWRVTKNKYLSQLARKLT